MLNTALIELSLDNLDAFKGEARRKADYILDQLVCHEREGEDVTHLTESLKRLVKLNQIGV